MGTNKYDESRTIDDEEKIVMNFVLGSISHQHFAIDRRRCNAAGEGMVVKDLSRNGTFVSFEGGEFVKAQRVVDGKFDSVPGLPIHLGSRIRLGSESDHRLEVMTDAAASGVIEAFVSVRELMSTNRRSRRPRRRRKRGSSACSGGKNPYSVLA